MVEDPGAWSHGAWETRRGCLRATGEVVAMVVRGKRGYGKYRCFEGGIMMRR
jgi:hypothetical protein